MLEPQVNFIGIPGLRKAAREFPAWKDELSPQGYRNSLLNILEFIGSVPKLPNIVMGFDAPEDEGFLFQACRDKMGNMLNMLGEAYENKNWRDAGELFLKSGKHFEKMADLIIKHLVKVEGNLEEVPTILGSIADLEEAAYLLCTR